MRLFFRIFLLAGLGIFSLSAYGQLDDDTANVPEGLKNPLDEKKENAPYKPQTNHSLTDPEYKSGFSNPAPAGISLEEEKKDFNMYTGNGLKQRMIDFEPTYLQKFKDSGGKGYQTTQYLGEFASRGKFVEIYCRDHEYVDGDLVQVYINGEIVARRIVLGGTFRPVLVDLKKGMNRIEFKALNEGTSSPNTAEFIVYDEWGGVITQNRWNLAAGVKAQIVVHRKSGEGEKELSFPPGP